MKNKFTFLLILIAFQGFAQNYTGTLSTINQEGLHLILLDPEVRSATHSNTNFFRILDSKKNEVAYVNFQPKTESNLDLKYPVLTSCWSLDEQTIYTSGWDKKISFWKTVAV
jgi:hypothetical protein